MVKETNDTEEVIRTHERVLFVKQSSTRILDYSLTHKQRRNHERHTTHVSVYRTSRRPVDRTEVYFPLVGAGRRDTGKPVERREESQGLPRLQSGRPLVVRK